MAANGPDGDQTRSFTTLAAGTKVSHYKIISKIGAGGMGEVYLAEDTQLDRKVALKFLPHHLSRNEAARARFTREAKAAAKLDHPNIVPVYEVGEYQGRPYFAMAHIEGQSLRQVIKEGKLSINEAIRLTKQICEGLHKAHESGVVHRDIKPGNIIVDGDNKARILDFGLATVAGEDKLTKTGSTLGTVGYMSPEQVEGKKCDHRSDIFSVGVILYEMLTGRRPFEGDTDAAVARSITDTTPEPIARYKSGTTGELQQIVDKALTKDPALRYQHADELLADLERLESIVTTSTKHNLGRILIPAAITVIAVLVVIFKPWKFEINPRQEAAAQENKLAVMYFDNLADPEDSQKLGEIATNLLITDLSESDYLEVVSSQYLYDLCRQFGKGTGAIDRDIASQIAQKARARYMLLGKILKSSPNFIITTELVDNASGNAVAAKRIEGAPGQDIFPLIDSLTIAIKRDLNLPSKAMEESDPAVAGITTSSLEAYRLYISAVNDYYNVLYGPMINKLQRCLEIDSTFAMACILLSSRYQGKPRQDLIDRAVRYSSQASEKEKLFIKALKADYEHDFGLSIELLAQVVKRYPDEKEAYRMMGEAYRRQGLTMNTNAIAAFRTAIDLDPKFGAVHNALAFAYFDQGDFENSFQSINRYIELSDSCANSLDSKGVLYGFMGNAEKAIESFRLALEVDSTFIPSLQSIGEIHAAQGEYDEAERYIRQLILYDNFGVRALGRLLISLIPINQGELVDALKVLDNGIVADRMEYIHFRTARKYLWKAAIFRELSAYDSAMTAMDEALTMVQRLLPERVEEIRFRSAELMADINEYDRAISTVEDIRSEINVGNKPLLYKYWYTRAYIELARNNCEESVDYAEKACLNTMRTSIDYMRFHALLGRAYMACGRLGDAVTEFEQIVNMYGECRRVCPIISIKIRYWLGMAYEASGWTSKAIEQYETFLDIWKNADKELKSVEDAKTRLARLKETI